MADGDGPAEGPRRVEARIAAEVAQISEARRLVRQVISQGGLSVQRAFDLEVAVSEACANAIVHSGHAVELAAWRLRDRIVVEVSSRGESGSHPTQNDERRLPFSLSLMTTLADQVQISRLSESLIRLSLTFSSKRRPALPSSPLSIPAERQRRPRGRVSWRTPTSAGGC